MHVVLVGLNHRSAPLEVREKVAFTKEELRRALLSLKSRIGEGVLLSTCNRTEVYSVAPDPERGTEALEEFLCSYRDSGAHHLSPYLYRYGGMEAVHHLFRVASGLDSMILGESQILGQVRDSLEAAARVGSLGLPLSRLFHHAIRTGRRVREETEIGRNALSVSYAAVQLARRTLGELGGLRVLLVGAGDTGKLVARALRTVGVGEVLIANRTQRRGEELVRQLGGRAIPFAAIGGALAQSSIVITSTDSPDFIITRDMVTEALTYRGDGPLFIFDLALPRDVDPSVEELEGVHLFNIDDLSSVSEENLKERGKAAAQAEQIVAEELARFEAWWRSLEAVPLIRALRSQAEVIRQRELAKALRRLPALSAQDQATIDALTRSIVKKLLHQPIASLKDRRSTSFLQAAQQLFRLPEQGSDKADEERPESS